MHWKWATLYAAIAWTIWGVLIKFSLSRIDWVRLEVLTAATAIIFMAVFFRSGFQLKFCSGDIAGVLVGIAGVAGTIFFYMAMSKGPATVVVPLSSLYVVGVFIAGVLFLGEEWTWRKALGVAFAATAVFLLSGEKT